MDNRDYNRDYGEVIVMVMRAIKPEWEILRVFIRCSQAQCCFMDQNRKRGEAMQIIGMVERSVM